MPEPIAETVHQAPLEGLGWVGHVPRRGEVAADLVRLEQADADLDALEAVLARLDRDEDGTCATCGLPLDADAVAADPLLQVCPAH